MMVEGFRRQKLGQEEIPGSGQSMHGYILTCYGNDLSAMGSTEWTLICASAVAHCK